MEENKFVSRGGIKLQAAIENWNLKIENLTVLDAGSSTGGFVDCLLQNGASKVYSVDTAYGELAWKLRNDPKVVVMERKNILYLKKLPEKVDLITLDLGWTKLELALPIIREFLKPGGIIIALLKPQYETEVKNLIKGIVDPKLTDQIKDQVIFNLNNLGFEVKRVMESPILGGSGNKEYLLEIIVA